MSRSRTLADQEGETDRGEAEPPSPDTVFDILSNSRRREVIKCLHDRDGSVDVRSLVNEVAAAENDVEVASVTYEQRKRVYTTLHQSHLPKLVQGGFLERDGDQVQLTENAERLKAHIELEATDDYVIVTDGGDDVWDRLRSWWPF
jgi:fibronectin type 3 domain-containing protein